MKEFNLEEFNLGESLSPEKRLEIYEKALDLYKSKSHTITDLGVGLCLVLPSLLFKLSSFLDDQPNGEIWLYKDTISTFIELKEYVYPNESYRNEDRIKILEQCIIDIKQLIKPIKTSWSREEHCKDMQYYMEYCLNNEYVTPMKWLDELKHY